MINKLPLSTDQVNFTINLPTNFPSIYFTGFTICTAIHVLVATSKNYLELHVMTEIGFDFG